MECFASSSAKCAKGGTEQLSNQLATQKWPGLLSRFYEDPGRDYRVMSLVWFCGSKGADEIEEL